MTLEMQVPVACRTSSLAAIETFTETRPIRKMLDEVQRATMWQRVAPAYRMDAYQTVISDEALADTWVYSEEDTWDWGRVQGREVTQKAPAVIARGIDMPVVTAVDGGQKPLWQLAVTRMAPSASVHMAGLRPIRGIRLQRQTLL